MSQDTSNLASALDALIKSAGEPVLISIIEFKSGIHSLAEAMTQHQIDTLTPLVQDPAINYIACNRNRIDEYARIARELNSNSEHEFENWITILFRIAWLKRIMEALKSTRDRFALAEGEASSLEEALVQVWVDDGIRFGHEFSDEFKSRIPSTEGICKVSFQCKTQEERRYILGLILHTVSIYYSISIGSRIYPTLLRRSEKDVPDLVDDLSFILSSELDRRISYKVLDCLQLIGSQAQPATPAVIKFARSRDLIDPNGDINIYAVEQICETLNCIGRQSPETEPFLCELADQLSKRNRYEGLGSVLHSFTLLSRTLSESTIEYIKGLLSQTLDDKEAGKLGNSTRNHVANCCLQVLLKRDQKSDQSVELVERGQHAFPSDHAYALQVAHL